LEATSSSAEPAWLAAAEALRIAADRIGAETARDAILAAARAGAVRAQAGLFTVELANACGAKGLIEEQSAELPPEFWTSDGQPLAQDWDAGSFTSWVNGNFQRQAFDVAFDEAGIRGLAAG
jgi:hypothetical protein